MEYAYLAGLIDSDGCIGIYSNKGNPSITVSIQFVNTCEPLMERLVAEHGGSYHKTAKSRNPNHKPCFVWQLKSKDASVFLRSILPHMRIKGAQAELALEALAHRYAQNYRGRKVPQEVVEYRQLLVRRSSELNKTGVN